MRCRTPHRSTRTAAPSRPGQAGFTIIETLVAALIVMLLGLAVVTALVTQSQASGDEQLRSEAGSLVNQNEDRLRGMTDQSLAALASSGPTSQTTSATGTTFTVTSSASVQDAAGNSSCNSTGVDYFHINTTVTWSAGSYGGTTRTASADSLLSRPVTGVLETQVVNQLGTGLGGATVTVTPTGTTPGSAQTATTDSSGCVVLAALPAGNYAVAAVDSGYVNNVVSSSTPSTASTSAAVTATGSVASASLVLGLAGSLNATFAASASSAAPTYAGQADALTYTGGSQSNPYTSNQVSTNATASHSTTLAAGQTSLTTSASLFPFNQGTASSPSYTNDYSAYAGQCSFQNPFPSGSSTTNLATVAPGANASATIQEPFLYVNSVTANGTQVTPRDIVLTYSAGGCTDQYAAMVATGTNNSGSGNYGGVIYGQTVPTNGWLADPGQPYAPTGDLTVCADVLYGGNTFFAGTATVANTSLTGRNTLPTITINTNQAASCPGITS